MPQPAWLRCQPRPDPGEDIPGFFRTGGKYTGFLLDRGTIYRVSFSQDLGADPATGALSREKLLQMLLEEGEPLTRYRPGHSQTPHLNGMCVRLSFGNTLPISAASSFGAALQSGQGDLLTSRLCLLVLLCLRLEELDMKFQPS